MSIEMSGQSLVFVRDIKLASCLVTLGVRLRNPEPIERISRNGAEPFCVFWFHNDGSATDFIKAWESSEEVYGDPGHPLADSSHPFWLIRAALRNRERLLDGIRQAKVFVSKFKGGSTYLFTLNPNGLQN